MDNKIISLAERIQNQQFFFIQVTEKFIILSYSIYQGFFPLQPKRVNIFNDYKRIILDFADQETETLFTQFKIDEITDQNLIEVMNLIFMQNHDELDEYVIGDGQYEVPVVQQDLIAFINYCDTELNQM
ncbi:hypothetical protein SS50377_22246 [Spironucleus salmonicida]|uniref:Uncharacterized protein n=1 Tax=Spironucleus salmonicida TaxID=348837 RepID=V6LCT7_9EUKA|nr:hypothetical protein SS50377_22246 [Spironucleus salmonicida]|eukprot:EST42262.1 Hypothetical protein SS50377_18562 [Spironucleus salmonicida]